MLRKPICPNALRNAYASGETLKQIADMFGCSDKTIWRHARELGLQHPKAYKRRHADTGSVPCPCQRCATLQRRGIFEGNRFTRGGFDRDTS